MNELTDQKINALSNDERIAYRKAYFAPVIDFLYNEMKVNEESMDEWLSCDSKWFNDYCLSMSMKEMMMIYMKDRQ